MTDIFQEAINREVIRVAFKKCIVCGNDATWTQTTRLGNYTYCDKHANPTYGCEMDNYWNKIDDQ